MKKTTKKIDLSTVSDNDLITELHNRTGKGNLLAVKIWRREDIGADLPGMTRTLTDDECKQVADYVGTIDSLEEATDDDWYSLADACKVLGIDCSSELAGND